MKRLFCVILFLMGTCVSSRCYSIKCEKCVEDSKARPGIEIGIAVRQWAEPTEYRDGFVYGWYRCCYGHHYLTKLGGENVSN